MSLLKLEHGEHRRKKRTTENPYQGVRAVPPPSNDAVPCLENLRKAWLAEPALILPARAGFMRRCFHLHGPPLLLFSVVLFFLLCSPCSRFNGGAKKKGARRRRRAGQE